MLNTKLSPWPCFTQDETDAVHRVLSSNKVSYWTGQEGREFEKEFAAYTDSQFAIALANGTVAIDLALVILNIGRGDEVIVTSRTFLASASSIINAGAIPVFADIDLNSQNITPETIAPLITAKTKAILCVHLGGYPCDMPAIMTLAEQHNLLVIEDCAQAHGATINGKSVGSFGHMSAWSFCQDKIMTTGGEGGMVTTNDEQLWKKAWAYKDHGKSWEAVYVKQHPPGYRWLHESFGTNWRLTEMQSVIGRVQLTKLPQWTKLRRANAQQIFDACQPFNFVKVPNIPENIGHAFYKCYVNIDIEKLPPAWSRDRIIDEINALDIPCYSGSCSEVYLEKAFDNTPFRPKERLPNAKRLAETSLMFLVHPNLTQYEMKRTCDAITHVFTLVANDLYP